MLYENVKEIADSKGMSISKVERNANLSKGTISKWKTASPTLVSLQAVAKTLGVSISRLTREKNDS